MFDTFGDLEMALNLELHGHTYALGNCCYVLDTHIEQHRIPLVDLNPKSNCLTVAEIPPL